MSKIISKNKNANFNYEKLDSFEAGIVLKGWEIKSIRSGNVNLKGSFCSFHKDELYASNISIARYMDAPGDELQPRKLLLHKSQLKKIRNLIKQKGVSVVPKTLKLNSKGIAKLDILIGRGRNTVDKRELIKTRDYERNSRKKNKGM